MWIPSAKFCLHNNILNPKWKEAEIIYDMTQSGFIMHQNQRISEVPEESVSVTCFSNLQCSPQQQLIFAVNRCISCCGCEHMTNWRYTPDQWHHKRWWCREHHGSSLTWLYETFPGRPCPTVSSPTHSISCLTHNTYHCQTMYNSDSDYCTATEVTLLWCVY